MAAVLLVGVVLMVAGVLAVSAVAALVGALVWLVLLPFRLVFFVVKLAVLGLAGGLGIAALVIAGVLVAAGLLLAVLAPLLPLALVVGLIWMLFRSSRRPARA
jgi:hypothetical protein